MIFWICVMLLESAFYDKHCCHNKCKTHIKYVTTIIPVRRTEQLAANAKIIDHDPVVNSTVKVTFFIAFIIVIALGVYWHNMIVG